MFKRDWFTIQHQSWMSSALVQHLYCTSNVLVLVQHWYGTSSLVVQYTLCDDNLMCNIQVDQ